MRKSSWRKIYELPPGYVQDSLFQAQQQEQSEKTSLFKILARSIIVVGIFALFTAYLTQQIHLMSLGHKITYLEKQLEAVHKDNEKLRLEYTQAENLSYVEQIARTRLGMIKPQNIYYLKSAELANIEYGSK